MIILKMKMVIMGAYNNHTTTIKTSTVQQQMRRV